MYSSEELNSLLPALPGWVLIQDELEKQFSFDDFAQALAFIVRVGIISEKHNHHPLLTNVYNKVTLRISTHSEKAITDKDLEWIKAVETIRG